MPKGYTRLAYEQRCQIYALLKMGVSQSTINREVWRNKGMRGYRYEQAQKKERITKC